MHFGALTLGLRHQCKSEVDGLLNGRVVIPELAVDRSVVDRQGFANEWLELLHLLRIKGPTEPEAVFLKRWLQGWRVRRAAVGIEAGLFHRAELFVETPFGTILVGLVTEGPGVDDEA